MLILIFLEYFILPAFFYIFTIVIAVLGGVYLACVVVNYMREICALTSVDFSGSARIRMQL